MLDIMPVKDNGLTSCIDAQLEAFGRWKKTGYELMYLDCWKFVFKEAGTKGPEIWSRGELAPRLYFEDQLNTKKLFAKYHGVRLEVVELDLMELRDKLDDIVLRQRMPVLVFFDTFYLPWLEKFYKKFHTKHTIMAIGKERDGYLFNDTRPFLLEPIHGGYLDWEHLSAGYGNGINCFYEEKVKVDYDDIRMNLVGLDFSMFEAMREFAKYIEENCISKEDMEEFDGGNGILIRALRNIVTSRVHYQEMLGYVNNKYPYTKLDSFIEVFHDIINKWNMIKNLTYKAYLVNDYSKYNYKLSRWILECAELEEKSAELLGKSII